MDLTLYNTATRTKERFTPLNPGEVLMYNCGPTVYNYVHVGNLRAYVFADILRRTLEWSGYRVRQIVNITDVGHLVSDGDDGEDKMEVGARREGRTIEEIIAHYSDAFFADLELLNIKKASLYPRATHYIDAQRSMIETLHQKGYLYTTSDGIYFDTTKFPDYGALARIDIEGLRAGARVDIGEKRNPTDFAVWKFSKTDGGKREQEWPSPIVPERLGFPGWHIECSAIINQELGVTIDIHTGGIDHIPVHHTNEIAQSECANNAPFVHYWMHCAFMNVEGEKMSKSLNNTYRLNDLHERGIPPLAYRYWLLTAHYRTQANFTWNALAGAQSAYNRLTNIILELSDTTGIPNSAYLDQFTQMLNDDLNTPQAIALIWQLVKDDQLTDGDKYATLLRFDEVLGLGIATIRDLGESKLPEHIAILAEERRVAREAKDFSRSDTLRDQLKSLGYEAKDGPNGQTIRPL